MQKKILILGSSFAGFAAALELRRRFEDRHLITVVARDARFVFSPTQVAASPEVELETAMRNGNPSLEILAAAKELKADLIVMGTHGRTGFSHGVRGSTAERVVRTAPCSVLTVHARPAGRPPTV